MSQFYYEDIRGDMGILFRKIGAIRQMALVNKDPSLARQMDLLKANYFVFNGSANSSFTEYLLEKGSIDAAAANDTLVLALYEHFKAFWYWRSKNEKPENLELAFEHWAKEYDLLKNRNDQRKIESYPSCLHQIALAYYQYKDYPHAISFLKQLLSPNKYAVSNYLMREGNQLLGYCYRKVNNLDSSDYYYMVSYKAASKANDGQWKTRALGGIGINLLLRGRYKEAESLIQLDVDSAIARQDFNYAADQMIPLAVIKLQQKKFPIVWDIIKKSRNYVGTQNINYDYLSELYTLMAKYYLNVGNVDIAEKYIDSAMNMKDSSNRKASELLSAKAFQKSETENQNRYILKIENSKKVLSIQFYWTISILALVFAFGIYIFIIQRKRNQELNLLKNAELKEKEIKLIAATEQLNIITENIIETNQLIEALQLQQGIELDEEVLSELRQSTILTGNDWERFRHLFEQVHRGYLQKLNEKIPGISPAEIRFMALAKLNLSNKEIAFSLGVSPQAVRVTRHRLRKKLQLPEEITLENLIHTI